MLEQEDYEMSLLDSFYKEYKVMNHTAEDDPEGGWITGWTPGATVEMALDEPTQTQRIIAESQKVEVIQNALFPIGTPVALGTYLRLIEDESMVYRVQTNPIEAPGPSNIKVMRAEVIKTRLPA